MRIVAIREKTVALSSSLRNASIRFGGMTASALAMLSDVVRDGKPVIGLAFDSVGRYGHGGLLRERFIPRVLAADPEGYAGEPGVGPFRIWEIAVWDEKPGGHGERSGAVGLIDAAWDLAAKLEDKPPWTVLAERFGDGAGQDRVPVHASVGPYHAEDDLRLLAEEVRRCLGLGFRTVKTKAGGAPLAADRYGARRARWGGRAHRRLQRRASPPCSPTSRRERDGNSVEVPRIMPDHAALA